MPKRTARAVTVPACIAAILLLAASRLQAQTYTLAPPPYQTVQNTSGAIVVNGCVWTYAAGTTTPIATYTDTSGTLNGNPIIADSSGRFVAYLLPGTNYKFVYELTPCSAPSTHGTVLKTQDNIQGVPSSSANVDIVGTAGEALTAGQCAYLSDGSGSKTVGQWYRCDSANTYSATLPVVGLAITAISSATTGTFRIAGYATGLSSLTAGAPYFVSGTAGSLTSTAPANRRLVGTADTTTTLIVTANPFLAFGSGSVGAPSVWIGTVTNGLYSSGTNALDVATNGVKALGIDSTQFIDSPTQPRTSAYNSTTQSLTNNTITALALDTEDYDVGSLHSNVTNNSRMTIPTGGDGLYYITGQASYASNATGGRAAEIAKNGTTVAAAYVQSVNGTLTTVPVSCVLVLAAADYIELNGWQASGGNLNAGNVVRGYTNILQIVKLW